MDEMERKVVLEVVPWILSERLARESPSFTMPVAMSKRRRSDLTAHPATRKRSDVAADLGCELHLRICPTGRGRLGGFRGDEGSPS